MTQKRSWKLISFLTRKLDFGYIHKSLSANCKFSSIYFSLSDIDDCNSYPCENGATCRDAGVNNYTCTCKDGYESINCSQGIVHYFSSGHITVESKVT